MAPRQNPKGMVNGKAVFELAEDLIIATHHRYGGYPQSVRALKRHQKLTEAQIRDVASFIRDVWWRPNKKRSFPAFLVTHEWGRDAVWIATDKAKLAKLYGSRQWLTRVLPDLRAARRTQVALMGMTAPGGKAHREAKQRLADIDASIALLDIV
jgi:hypothetical protein